MYYLFGNNHLKFLEYEPFSGNWDYNFYAIRALLVINVISGSAAIPRLSRKLPKTNCYLDLGKVLDTLGSIMLYFQ